MNPRVAIVRCPDYTPQRIAAAVSCLIDALGGISSIVGRSADVLIKPNLLTDAAPEKAKTTHPEVVRALIRLMHCSGASVSVGDSPAKAVAFERVWERTGFKSMCAREGAVCAQFEKLPTAPLECAGQVLRISQPVIQAGLVINVPKVKTHLLTTFTGAVKNLYGCLPGYQKTLLHRAFPTPSEFGRLPAALYDRIRPGLNVADAIVGMQGAGPSGGDPVHLGFLAASTDAVALDTALCAALGIDVRRLPWRRYLPSRCAPALDPAAIHYPLLEPRDVQPEKFRVPASLWPRLIPGPLIRGLSKLVWIRPRFGPECVRCGRCVQACCNAALSLRAEASTPTLIPERCIACCCCHEVCPARAVAMQQSPLMNLFRRKRTP